VGLATERLEGAPATIECLTRLWPRPRSILSWLAAVDHETLGKRYIITAFVFFALGGVEAAIIRAKLARRGGRVYGEPEVNGRRETGDVEASGCSLPQQPASASSQHEQPATSCRFRFPSPVSLLPMLSGCRL
jgi:hypothetical protein